MATNKPTVPCCAECQEYVQRELKLAEERHQEQIEELKRSVKLAGDSSKAILCDLVGSRPDRSPEEMKHEMVVTDEKFRRIKEVMAHVAVAIREHRRVDKAALKAYASDEFPYKFSTLESFLSEH